MSATAQQLFAQREACDTTRTADGQLVLRAPDHAMHGAASRAWSRSRTNFRAPAATACGCRVKREGRVITGAFDADVR